MADLLDEESENWQGRNTFEEPDYSTSLWFFSREDIDRCSPSRKDGIDTAKEAYLRRSYCTFLQDLGMRLKVPQLTIATAIVFCHRFYLRQSHARNDRFVIATVCMFLAGKVEESPKLLQNVITIAYEIRHRKDPETLQKIKIKEVYEKEKELVLLGERLVLSTLGFDLHINHPYRPLVNAIKKLKVAQNSLAQVAWNFINDGLRTSLCLQFKPHHIAAGAIFLAAKFLKVKLPSNGRRPWWQEFDVTPRQLEDVSNQMLELYEQNREIPASRSSDAGITQALHHDKRTGALPPGTPQVAEKRSAAEIKARAAPEASQQSNNQAEAKPAWVDFEHVNIDKIKTAVEKRRKFKAEGGGTKSKLELTDEEELLEWGMENGHKDGQSENNVGDHYGRFSHSAKTELTNQSEITDMDLETTDRVNGSSENNKQRHIHASEADHVRRQKIRDWQEREHKRSRYEHAT